MANSTRDSAQVAKVRRSRDYYLRGGDITFLVENNLYRVHSYFFDRESTFFHQKLSNPLPPGEDRVGASDSNAFTLENVRSADFERFLWVFYNPKYSLYDKSVEEWTSILELANEWSFVEVKNLAVRELEKLEMHPIERIYIYHRYHIDRTYLITSYATICTRPETLNLTEGRKLGLETALQVAEARERIRAAASEKSGARSPTFADFHPEDVDTIIREVFEVHVRSDPLSVGGGPSPASGPSASHSRSSSGAWPPAQTVVTTPQPPRQQQQNQQQQRQQEQHMFSSTFGPNSQSPAVARPSSGTFGGFFGLGAGLPFPTTGSDVRAEEQSPINGTGSSGEPHSISANTRSPAEGQQAGGMVADEHETPVDSVAAGSEGGGGGSGETPVETPVEDKASPTSEAPDADENDDENDDDVAAEGEKQGGEGGGDSFPKSGKRKSGGAGTEKDETTKKGESSSHEAAEEVVDGGAGGQEGGEGGGEGRGDGSGERTGEGEGNGNRSSGGGRGEEDDEEFGESKGAQGTEDAETGETDSDRSPVEGSRENEESAGRTASAVGSRGLKNKTSADGRQNMSKAAARKAKKKAKQGAGIVKGDDRATDTRDEEGNVGEKNAGETADRDGGDVSEDEQGAVEQAEVGDDKANLDNSSNQDNVTLSHATSGVEAERDPAASNSDSAAQQPVNPEPDVVNPSSGDSREHDLNAEASPITNDARTRVPSDRDSIGSIANGDHGVVDDPKNNEAANGQNGQADNSKKELTGVGDGDASSRPVDDAAKSPREDEDDDNDFHDAQPD